MTNHWQLLALTPDADERSIKRAYARLLKTHRPDENADSFQRLREAYEASLAEARWRVEGEGEEAANAISLEPLPVQPPSEAAPLQVRPVDGLPLQSVDTLVASPPEPSLLQMQQWLADGKDRQVLEALRHWLASDWLIPFANRQQFEHSVFEWLEAAQGWSPAFFDSVCRMMRWDDTHGDVPVEPWRWHRLIRRCEVQAMADSLRAELDTFEGNDARGRAATLLLKPLTDSDRRQLADKCEGHDWHRFTELAHTFEYHYPELPEHLGLKPLNHWRNWLPANNCWEVSLFLWLAISAVVILGEWARNPPRLDMVAMVLLPLMVAIVIGIGSKAYSFWAGAAVASGRLDITVSKYIVPSCWYRDGAGLLIFRHLLPTVVPAGLAYLWSGSLPWLKVISPVLVCLGALYFTDMALSGKASVLGRMVQGLQHQLQRLPWHWLRQESVLGVLAVVGALAAMYLSVRP
jgi:hypothetical protein